MAEHGSKHLGVLVLMAAIAAIAPAAVQAQTLTNADLPQAHATYEANQARFMRDYKGRWFAAVVPFYNITENPILRGRYTMTFGKGVLGGDISCDITNKAQIDQATDYNKGDLIGLRGLVDDHFMGSVMLKDCAFQK